MKTCLCVSQATPKLSEDKVKQCVDARLNGEYPPKAVAKVTTFAILSLFHAIIDSIEKVNRRT